MSTEMPPIENPFRTTPLSADELQLLEDVITDHINQIEPWLKIDDGVVPLIIRQAAKKELERLCTLKGRIYWLKTPEPAAA